MDTDKQNEEIERLLKIVGDGYTLNDFRDLEHLKDVAEKINFFDEHPELIPDL